MFEVHISKHSLFRLKITVGCLTSTYPSIHFSLDEDTLKIMVGCLTSAYPSVHKKLFRVGCPLCTYPSIHVETLRITVGCLWSTYPSIRNKNLHTCGLWARPPVLTPVPVPSQAIHSRAGLNLHYSDIQSTAQKSPCTTAPASCRRPGTRTRRRQGRHATPGDPALWTRAKTKAQIWAKGPPDKRKKKERELFITGIFPARDLFFITVLN